MAFIVEKLPYDLNALEPYVSQNTLSYHYGKHYPTYCSALNKLTENTEYADMPLEEVIQNTRQGPIFNNAAQTWNHAFFWKCMKPNGGGKPEESSSLAQAIVAQFGSVDQFRQEFLTKAVGNFGSGWTWLVRQSDGTISIVNTSNAGNPMTDMCVPILVCDVWEHAYYLDYCNARANFVQNFLDYLLNWDFSQANFEQADR